MNVIARLEYELAYYDSAIHRFNHYTTRTPPLSVHKAVFSYQKVVRSFSVNQQKSSFSSALSSRADVTFDPFIYMHPLVSFVLTVSIHKIPYFYFSPSASNSSFQNPSHFCRDRFPLATLIFIIFLFSWLLIVATRLYIFMWQPSSQYPVGSLIVPKSPHIPVPIVHPSQPIFIQHIASAQTCCW